MIASLLQYFLWIAVLCFGTWFILDMRGARNGKLHQRVTAILEREFQRTSKCDDVGICTAYDDSRMAGDKSMEKGIARHQAKIVKAHAKALRKIS